MMFRWSAFLFLMGLACLAQARPGPDSNYNVSIASSGGGCCVLDSISGLKYAFSTRKLLSAYAGNALTVTRASDSTTSNIGFSSNILNTSALTSFCTGTSCTVTQWYDQSGGGYDLNNSGNAGTFPTIYTSGAIQTINSQPALLFNTANTCIYNTTSPNPNPVNIYYANAVVNATSVSSPGAFVASQGAGFEWRYTTANKLEILHEATASLGTSTGTFTTSTAFIAEVSYNASGGAWAFWIDRSASGTGTTSSSFTSGHLTAGNRGSGLCSGEAFSGIIGELISFDSVGGLSGGNQTAIENNQHTYWGTP